VDETEHALLYLVHLQNGFTIEINVGFVESRVPTTEDNTEELEDINNIIDSQENEGGGRASSFEDLEEDEDGTCMHWAPELLHNHTQQFTSTYVETEMETVLEVRDDDVIAVARSLTGWGEERQDEGDSMTREEDKNSVGERTRARGRPKEKGRDLRPSPSRVQEKRPAVSPAAGDTGPRAQRAAVRAIAAAARAATAAARLVASANTRTAAATNGSCSQRGCCRAVRHTSTVPGRIASSRC
jgi:hypothetical protein